MCKLMVSLIFALLLVCIASARSKFDDTSYNPTFFTKLGDYDDGKFKQIYYYSKNFLLDWNDAFVFCRQFDMNLAVIETKSEETALFALISKDPKYKVEFASIGGTKVNSKVWYWLQTEEKINYNMQWGRGEPSNFQDDDELCLGIVKKGTQTGFCDMACTTGEKRGFICEARFSI